MLTRPVLLHSLILLVSAHAHAMIGGVDASNQKFSAVGAIKVAGSKSVSCTATLIAANWIVTADHCVHDMTSNDEEGSGSPLKPSQYEFRVGSDFTKPAYKVALKRWISAPPVGEENIDMAFGELTRALPIKNLKISLIEPRAQNWDQADRDADYLAVGYGVQVPFSNQHFPLTDKRQQASLRIAEIRGNAMSTLFGSQKALENYLTRFDPSALEAQDVSSIYLAGELTEGRSVVAWDPRGRADLADLDSVREPKGGWQDTCFGDSGGPLLRERNGKLEIIGVVSQGMNRVCSPLGTRFTTFGTDVQRLMISLGLKI